MSDGKVRFVLLCIMLVYAVFFTILDHARQEKSGSTKMVLATSYHTGSFPQ